MRSSQRTQCVSIGTATVALMLTLTGSASAQSTGNRILGIDVSRHQGTISQTTWNNIRNVDNRQFVIVRSSRGGTTGEDRRQGGYPSNDNDFFTASQRYDDPYFLQNITRATAAGMYAGTYHFSRPDVIVGSLNSNGSVNSTANSGIDEANHFMQMAGEFMRPGYLPPVHDLEAGDTARTDVELTQFTLDFSDRIYQVMGIRPALYINGNYALVLSNGTQQQRDLLAKPLSTSPNPAAPAYSQLWTARYVNQANPNSIPVQTAHPNDPITYIYGPFDDYNVTHPWVFWQYASTEGPVTSFNGNLDVNVAQGGIEYLKDQLIPAVWMNNSSGDWSTLSNWNSGQPVTMPSQGAGQLTAAPIDAGLSMPVARLPGAAGTGPTAGSNDTVILDRPSANITVTLSSGVYNIRKLYVRETLNITGGSLTINYLPVAESTPMSAQFSSPVSISGATTTFSVHTLYVDPAINFTVGGNATLTFNTLTLFSDTTPAKLVLNGNVTISGLSGATAKISTDLAGPDSGVVDLGGAVRTITVNEGAAATDLDIAVPVTNGGLTKAGAGTMVLSSANTYTGTTLVTAGTLSVTGSLSSASVQVSGGSSAGGTLKGTGTINGAVGVTGGTVPGSIRGGASIGTLTLTQPLAIGSGGRFIIEIGSGNAVAAGAINTGASTDLANLPNSQTRNSFIHIAAASGNSGLDSGMLVRIEASAATFAPNTLYSFLVMDGAGSQNFNINGISNLSQFSFIGVSVVPSSISLRSGSDGKVYLNFITPEPATMFGLGLLALPLLARRRHRLHR